MVGHLTDDDLTRLRAMTDAFLAAKHINGAAGFEPDALARASIALQACLPALNLGLRAYADFVEVIVYPDQFLVPRRHTDDAGVVHEGIEALAGEAMDGGPVVLSWADIAPGSHVSGGNVTIHEFVHKIDLLDGEADGVPPLPSARRAHWERLLERTYESFCDALEHVEAQIPRGIDPESAAADRYFATLPLDPYAATDPVRVLRRVRRSLLRHPAEPARSLSGVVSGAVGLLFAGSRPGPRQRRVIDPLTTLADNGKHILGISTTPILRSTPRLLLKSGTGLRGECVGYAYSRYQRPMRSDPGGTGIRGPRGHRHRRNRCAGTVQDFTLCNALCP
jgi:Mlc titration factor MtfA (ptsG expression regulator)